MARFATQARPARSHVPRLNLNSLFHVFFQRRSSRSHAMPTFHIELFEGRSPEQKRQFVEAITKATCESLGVEPNSVDIILTDVKRENWATGGRLWSEADA
ncbi:4-oxalocrotonate tautomerase [Paraburkholderia fungorum]|uniref:4-oxalocrotonate tautomerase n=1 Tax=Paraburkholderia fungorum TaxID=134537 RepID=UPI0038BA5E80